MSKKCVVPSLYMLMIDALLDVGVVNAKKKEIQLERYSICVIMITIGKFPHKVYLIKIFQVPNKT